MKSSFVDKILDFFSFLSSSPISIGLHSLRSLRKSSTRNSGSPFSRAFNSIADQLPILMDNLLNYYGHTGMDDRTKEEMDYQLQNQQLLNEEAYERQIDFYERFQSPSALVSQYKDAGLNPMLLAGSNPGASATSQPSGSAAGASHSGGDIMGFLSNVFSIFMKASQFDDSLILEKMRVGVAQFDAETRRQQVVNQKSLWDTIIRLNNQKFDYNEQLYPASIDNLKANTANLQQMVLTGAADEALKRANIGRVEAETALAIRQEALLQIQQKHADSYYSLQNSLLYYQNQIAATQNDFERRTLEKRIEIVNKQLDLMVLDETGKILQNGLAGYDFSTFKQRNAREWVNTGVRAVTALAGLAGGAGMLGKAAGWFGTPQVQAPSMLQPAGNTILGTDGHTWYNIPH